MSSKSPSNEAFIWMWLPNTTSPIVVGRVEQQGPELKFNYGKKYLEHKSRISIYEKELPLKSGTIDLLPGLSMPSCIRDGSPDSWGRRIIINRKFGKSGDQIDTDDLTELTYMLESGSDRIGALDFQTSSDKYKSRDSEGTSLETLLAAAELVEKGIPLPQDLDKALYHGTAIGGARPKALIQEEFTKYIAKFSSTSDTYSVIKAEYIAMKLAQLSGLNVANVKCVKAAQKDVLLIERFDRLKTKQGWTRKSMVSALTMLGLDENFARYASYQDLSEIIRKDFEKTKSTLKELFSRIVFNILCGNTDDHARNHAAFWDGKFLSLTPAYDICPQLRTGSEANQAMSIKGEERRSQLLLCLDAAEEVYMIPRKEALDIIEHIANTIFQNWTKTCDEVEVSTTDRNLFKNRQFFNEFAFQDLDGSEKVLSALKDDFKKK